MDVNIRLTRTLTDGPRCAGPKQPTWLQHPSRTAELKTGFTRFLKLKLSLASAGSGSIQPPSPAMPSTLPTATAPTADLARPYRLARRPEERIVLLGQLMDMVRPEEVMHFITGSIASGRRTLIANHNAHSLYLLRRNADFARYYGLADLVEVDSLPLLLWANGTGRRSRRFHRCTYLDWREQFWTLASKNQWRVFFLGGAPGVPEIAKQSLQKRWPFLVLDGRDGYFDMTQDQEQNASVVEQIAAFRPDVLFVGMGMPRQELWIQQNYEQLPNCVVLPVGAAFDYEAGVQKAAPRWMGRMGMEWAFRLVNDPSRLFRRYCVEPWFLIGMLAADAFAARSERQRARQLERRRKPVGESAGHRRRAADQRRTLPAG